MELLNYAFQFIRDVLVKIISNESGGIAKLRQDYCIKNTHTISI